jgi:hypothetical protein
VERKYKYPLILLSLIILILFITRRVQLPWVESGYSSHYIIEGQQVRLIVKDLSKSINFYKNLGFRTINKSTLEKGWIIVENHEAQIVLISDGTEVITKHVPNRSFVLRVKKINNLYDSYRSKNLVDEKPVDTQINTREFYISDPDNYLIVFSEIQ